MDDAGQAKTASSPRNGEFKGGLTGCVLIVGAAGGGWTAGTRPVRYDGQQAAF